MDRQGYSTNSKLTVEKINAQYGKLPPQAVEIEEAVLGAMMLGRDNNSTVSDIYDPSVFYKQEHQIIFGVIKKLVVENKPVDILIVTKALRDIGKLDEVGGPVLLAQLTDKVVSAINIDHHVRIIVQQFIKRELIRISTEITTSAYDDTIDVDDVIDLYDNSIVALDNVLFGKKGRELSKIVHELTEVIRERAKKANEGMLSGIQTGFSKLNRITAGWQDGWLVVFAARPAMGKGLPETEIVKTPNGNAQIGSLKIGDEICNTTGGVSIVIGVFPQGIRPCYEISFDDGMKCIADDQHLWEVSDRAARKKGSTDIRVMSTTELIKEGVLLSGARKNYAIKFPEPVFHTKKELIIDPYILGCLIGDGGLSTHSLKFSNLEDDIIEKFVTYFGDSFVRNHKDHGLKGDWIRESLKNVGLYGCKSESKFIPKQYLYSSIEDRTQLLRGLIDTDGFVVTPRCTHIEYSTVSEQLKNDVITLVRGLGGKCSFTTRAGRYKKDGEYISVQDNFRIWISFQSDFVPVSSKKHLEKYSNQKRFHKRFITGIKPVDPTRTVCIKVDSEDECFLMNDYLVTHNTAIGVNRFAKEAARSGKWVNVFSLEMDDISLTERLAIGSSGVESWKFKNGLFTEEDWKAYYRAVAELERLPIWIDDSSYAKISHIRNMARKNKRNGKCDMIVIDYLQLADAETSKNKNREQEVSEMSRRLKGLAKELKIPIILLSQLSREVEKRGTKQPVLSDLRESGAIEQDADLVIFPFRPDYYGLKGESGESLKNIGKLIIAKNRHGGTGELTFWHNDSMTDFSDEDPANAEYFPIDYSSPSNEKEEQPF